MNRESELYLAAERRAQASAQAPRMGRDPAADAKAEERAAVAKATAEVRGADDQLDAAIRDLHALEGQVAAELSSIERTHLTDPAKAASDARKVADEAERRLAVQLRAAETALTSARERVLSSMIPEPTPNTAAGLKRDELGRLLTAAKVSSSPLVAFETIFRDRARAGDRDGIANLVSGWGRATFLANGGTDEAWSDLRRALIVKAAEGPYRDAPMADRVRKLHSPSAAQATTAARFIASSAVDRIKKRGQ